MMMIGYESACPFTLYLSRLAKDAIEEGEAPKIEGRIDWSK